MENVVKWIEILPDYIGKGIVQLIVATVGGLIVGYFASSVFARKSETIAVKGAQLKRRHKTYEEFASKLELLQEMVLIPNEIHEQALKMLEDAGVCVASSTSNQIFKIFDIPQNLTEAILDTDRYISTHRIQFDDEVNLQSIRFQNYFITIRRLLTLYEEQFVNVHIDLGNRYVQAGERVLSAALGILLKDDLTNQINAMSAALRKSLDNPIFSYRSDIQHSYEYYNDENGPIVGYLKDSVLLSKNVEIQQLIAEAIGMAMLCLGELRA